MMNLKQAMAALALGLKVRRITWDKGEHIYIYENEIIDERGNVLWASLLDIADSYSSFDTKWEVFNAQETDE